MRKFIQWFFIIGSFVFLYWYMPLALKDNMVTLNEIIMIGINILSFLINLYNFFSSLIEVKPQ